MQISQVLPNLKSRWQYNWKIRQVSKRLKDISIQFGLYFFATLFLMLAFGELILILLPGAMQWPAIYFLAILYVCILGIVTAHCFDQNHIRFLLEQISIDLDYVIARNNKLLEDLNKKVTHQ